jgi:hypothetical protein
MLPGNMSSTASALVNMTNSTIHSSLLRVADPDDASSSGLGTKALLTVILFMGFALYIMSKTSVQQVLNRNQPQHYQKPEPVLFPKSHVSESTPLLKEEKIGENVRRSMELEAAMLRLSGQSDEKDTSGGAVEIQMTEVDLSRYLIPDETNNVPHTTRRGFG